MPSTLVFITMVSFNSILPSTLVDITMVSNNSNFLVVITLWSVITVRMVVFPLTLWSVVTHVFPEQLSVRGQG